MLEIAEGFVMLIVSVLTSMWVGDRIDDWLKK